MKEGGYHAWVTLAENNDTALAALVLAKSLRWSHTTKKLLVIITPSVTHEIKTRLSTEYDAIINLGKEAAAWNDLGLLQTCAKAHVLTLPLLGKAVFLNPHVIVINNMDWIFAENFGVMVKSGVAVLSLFTISSPLTSFQDYDTVMELMRTHKSKGLTKNGDGFQCKLFEKWLESAKGAIPLESETLAYISPTQMRAQGKNMENSGDDVIEYWKKLYHHVNQADGVGNEISSYHPVQEPIAIIGMSCRFPGGAHNLSSYWELLHSGRSASGLPVPPTRWAAPQYSGVTPEHRSTLAGFLSCRVDSADAGFFGLSPLDLFYMDPQLRLLLELVWEGLEDSGINPEGLKNTPNSTGIFPGAWCQDYRELLTTSGIGRTEFIRTYLGGSLGASGGRVGSFLGINGSNVATESACSSSAVAVGLAVKSLRDGSSSLAVASGVNLLIQPFTWKDFKPLVSQDGTCKSFDAAADGYGRSEGAGVLILKRLSDALASGDRIHALIRGYGAAQEPGAMGTPTVVGETTAMLRALQDAGLETQPERVTHVEAHGTGTLVGDSVELAALGRLYSTEKRATPLIITSGKGNIGHTESCSGMAGIIKTVLSLKHALIPVHIGCKEVSPRLISSLESIPGVIPTTNTEWKKTKNLPLMAGVSSFGFSGTNTHFILEAAPEPNFKKIEPSILPLQIVTLSAKSEESLSIMISDLQKHLIDTTISLADIAFTRNTARAHLHPHRATIVASSTADLLDQLETGSITAADTPKTKPQLIFLFSGQGAQYPDMGRSLYATFPVFRTHFDICANTLKETYGIDIRPVIWSDDEKSDPRIDCSLYSQTSIFTLEYALLRLWESWGVVPSLVGGHSLGEFAACAAAGYWSGEDAIRIVAERALLLDKGVHQGRMLVVGKSLTETETLLAKWNGNVLDICCVNSSTQTVVGGGEESVQNFKEFLQKSGVKSKILGSDRAFHSRHMDPILQKYRKVLESLTWRDGTKSVGFIGGGSGALVEEMGPDYWIQQMRQPVQFLDASRTMVELGASLCLDVSPHPVTAALFGGNLAEMGNSVAISCIPSLRKGSPELDTILSALSQLYTNGVDVDWCSFHKGWAGSRISLPLYPFFRKPYWFTAPSTSGGSGFTGKKLHPLLGTPIQTASRNLHVFQGAIQLGNEEMEEIKNSEQSQEDGWWLRDHVLGKHVIFPGAGYMELCLSSGFATTLASFEELGTPRLPMGVTQFQIRAPMAVGTDTVLQTIVEPFSDNSGEVSDSESQRKSYSSGQSKITIYKRQNENELEAGNETTQVSKWTPHASGLLKFLSPTQLPNAPALDTTKTNLASNGEDLITKFYKNLSSAGLKFGPAFQSLKQVWVSEKNKDSSILFEVQLQPGGEEEKYICHPILTDACIQATMFVKWMNAGPEKEMKLSVPTYIEEFTWLASPSSGDKFYVQIFHDLQTATLHDSNKMLTIMRGLVLMETDLDTIARSVASQKVSLPSTICENEWRPQPTKAPVTIPTGNQDKFWLIFGPQSSPNRNSMATRVRQNWGRSVHVIRYNTASIQEDNLEHSLSPDNIDHFRQLFKTLKKSDQELEGIIYFGDSTPDPVAQQQDVTQGFLNLLKVLVTTKRRGDAPPPKVILITEGIIPVGIDSDASLPGAATLWGILRTFQSEFNTSMDTRCIDLDPGACDSLSPIEQIESEIWSTDGEIHVAYRSLTRQVPRCLPLSLKGSLAPLPLPSSDQVSLILPSSKAINDLKFGLLLPPPQHKFGVTIRVIAAGLNFKDVLSVIKPSPEFNDENCIAADFCGVVEFIGDSVTKWKIGDAVLGADFTQGALPSHMVMGEDRVVGLPPWMTFEEGACLPVVFSTAYHCLVDVGRVKSGETILIHAASGGVGLVAIQIAQRLGVKVIATAGNKRKRAYLSKRMGVQHVFSSRSTEFGAQVMQVTKGFGVNLVLNSLTGPGFKETSLSCLAEKGRFVEMSKLNVWSIQEAKCLRADVAYTVVDLTKVGKSGWIGLTKALHEWLNYVPTSFKSSPMKRLEPIPYTAFDAVCIRQALAHLQKAKHIGKVVVRWAPRDTGPPPLFNSRSTYLITGGVGGIGLELLKFMTIRQGAVNVVLMGRSTPTGKAAELIQSLNEQQKNVLFFQGDVGKMPDCVRMMSWMSETGLPPLRGVMHAAGTLSDGIILNQTWDKMEHCFQSKVSGAWNLHLLTASHNLEHFITYSSVAAVLGSMGQANHSAGNWFLDALVTYRLSLGLPGATVNWGQWAQVGVASDMEIPGLLPFTPTEAFNALEGLMRNHKSQALVCAWNLSMIKSLYGWTAANYLSELEDGETQTTSGVGRKVMAITTEQFWEEYEKNEGSDGKKDAVQNVLVLAFSAILKLKMSQELDVQGVFHDLGVDSMMIFEVKNLIQEIFGKRVSFSVGEISDCVTVSEMTGRLLEIIASNA